jgi:MFS family permease
MTSLTSTETALGGEIVRRALAATYVAFAGAGLAMASWASRIPQVRDRLHLGPKALGLVLLAAAAGSLVSLPLSGPLVARTGSQRMVQAMAVLFGFGIATVGIGSQIGVVPVVVGLFMMGFAAGAWDVAMNVQGAFVEQKLGQSVMSRLHAGFSVGTVVGALVGGGMVAIHVSVAVHLIAIAFVMSTSVVFFTHRFLAEHDHQVPAASVEDHMPRRGHFASWGERRTVLIGLFVLAFAFAEGVGNDWIAVAAIDGYHVADAVGTVIFAVFLAAMTLGRWFGPAVLDRFGRTRVVRSLAIVGGSGALLFVVSPVTWLAFVGALLWGLGTSLGFPVGMSAGADEPAFAAGRVSVIATIGYCAFLVGPPLIGFLGDHFSVLSALVAVAVLLSIAAFLSPVVQPPSVVSTSVADEPALR